MNATEIKKGMRIENILNAPRVKEKGLVFNGSWKGEEVGYKLIRITWQCLTCGRPHKEPIACNHGIILDPLF